MSTSSATPHKATIAGTTTEPRRLLDGLSTVVAVLLAIGFGFVIARWFMRRRG